MVIRKTQCDASDNPPLDGFNSDEDMSLGGVSRKSGQSSFSNYSFLQTAISRSKSQDVSVYLRVDHCRVYVHSGAKHNHLQYVCGTTKGKCTIKGHAARLKIVKKVGKSGYCQPTNYRTGTVLGGSRQGGHNGIFGGRVRPGQNFSW
jgi:hypothetical protein